MQRKHYLILVAAVTLLVAVGAAGVGYKLWRRSQNRLKPPPTSLLTAPTLGIGELPGLPPASVLADVPDVTVSEVARELRIVWSLRWAPDGRLFITERRGRLLVLKPGAAKPEVYARLSTALGGESGLMGLALHPDFPRQPFIYVMYTARKSGGGVNRVSRLRDTPAGGDDETVLIDDIPASRNHDGGALEFGPDGMLYVGTGDANVPGLAQELDKPNGRILRVRPDGSIPPDNPFPNSAVWAYGFRNVSGLAFHPTSGELWAASHGPSAVEPEEPKHMDSVYIVRKGANHGWPLHLGVSADPAYVSPIIFLQGPGDTPRWPSLPYGNVRTVGGQPVHDRPAQSGADAISRRWTGHDHQRRAVVAEPIRPFARGDAGFRCQHLRRHEQCRWPSRRELPGGGFHLPADAGSAVGRFRDTRSSSCM